MRAQAWALWGTLTAGERPAWESWIRTESIFGRGELAVEPELVFRAPHDILMGGVRVDVAGEHQLYYVVMNPPAAEHIRRFDLEHRHGVRVPEFPTTAVALKLVWYPVKAHGPTEVPVWDGEPARGDDDGNPPSSWKRRVAVSADGTEGTISVDRFYHRALTTPREVDAARVAWRDEAIEAGDVAVLVGVHATTKAVPNWTWATYWWHDAADRGPFADGKPALEGWRGSYLMDATLTAGVPSINPWLEAKFPGGLGSNCVSCHRNARYSAKEFLPVTHELAPAAADETDFLWSVALESR